MAIKAFRKLSKGDFRNLSMWIITMILAFSVLLMVNMIDQTSLSYDMLVRGHIFMIIITACILKAAMVYSKFVGSYTFPQAKKAK
jgi:hypothetical protein